MGPVFYLVQWNGGLPPISAVILGNWPHEFALAPSPGKGGRWGEEPASCTVRRQVRRASVMAITAPSQYVSYPEVFHVDE